MARVNKQLGKCKRLKGQVSTQMLVICDGIKLLALT